MDKELEAWSAKGLYQRLREAEREGEEWSRGVEGSWVEGEREALERWDEGRVGGWR